MHFYITILSLILGVTVTAIFDLDKLEYPFGLTSILGPIMVIFLVIYGYKTIRVSYRRFIEAWSSLLNVESMLGLVNFPLRLEKITGSPYSRANKRDNNFIYPGFGIIGEKHTIKAYKPLYFGSLILLSKRIGQPCWPSSNQ